MIRYSIVNYNLINTVQNINYSNTCTTHLYLFKKIYTFHISGTKTNLCVRYFNNSFKSRTDYSICVAVFIPST